MPLDLSGQLNSKGARNVVNTRMRATPEWRSAIQRLGLNPDGPLHLSDQQRKQLAQMLGVHNNMGGEAELEIDPAGNINTTHGWSGLPTWAKAAIIGGATVATAGAAGAFSGGAGAASAAGGAAGGVLPSTAIAPAAGSLFGAPALAAGGMPGLSAGLGTAAASAPLWQQAITGSTLGKEAAGGVGSKLLELGKKAIPGAVGLGTYAMTKPGSDTGGGTQDMFAQFPELRQALNMQALRTRQSQPLYEAVQQMALNLMPKSAFSAGQDRPGIPKGTY